jgi:rSAM/selenodomain-associated transferase 1
VKTLGIFARWPVPTKVKTRLSPALPAELACRLYRGMLHDALDAIVGAPADQRMVFWSEAPPERDGFVLPVAVRATDQRGANLGERLAAAFAELLTGEDDRAVILGADCPDLDAERIAASLEALDRHDLVLGPTLDGGYYLVGLGRRAPELFAGIAWSGPRVLEQTLAVARGRGLDSICLDALADLDTPGDLVDLVRRVVEADRQSPGRHTLAALHEMGMLPAAD